MPDFEDAKAVSARAAATKVWVADEIERLKDPVAWEQRRVEQTINARFDEMCAACADDSATLKDIEILRAAALADINPA